MTKKDFSVVTGKEKTVITFRKAVKIEVVNTDPIVQPSQMTANFIKQMRNANKIIEDLINGESTYLIAQALIHAIENQN